MPSGEATYEVLFHNALVEGPMAGDPADKLIMSDLYFDDDVVITENCVTSKGPATVIAMAVTLLELLRGEKIARSVAKDIAFRTMKKEGSNI
ncbi:putative class I glutamine amidotransferase [Plasmopara halstedii]